MGTDGEVDLIKGSQQRPHLVGGEHLTGPNGGVAGHGGEQLLDVGASRLARAPLREIIGDIPDEAAEIRSHQHFGHLLDDEAAPAEGLHLQAKTREQAYMFGQCLGPRGRQLDDRRRQEPLTAALLAALGDNQAEERDALVGGVLVDDDELTHPFAEDVGATELTEHPQVCKTRNGQETAVEGGGPSDSGTRGSGTRGSGTRGSGTRGRTERGG